MGLQNDWWKFSQLQPRPQELNIEKQEEHAVPEAILRGFLFTRNILRTIICDRGNGETLSTFPDLPFTHGNSKCYVGQGPLYDVVSIVMPQTARLLTLLRTNRNATATDFNVEPADYQEIERSIFVLESDASDAHARHQYSRLQALLGYHDFPVMRLTPESITFTGPIQRLYGQPNGPQKASKTRIFYAPSGDGIIVINRDRQTCAITPTPFKESLDFEEGGRRVIPNAEIHHIEIAARVLFPDCVVDDKVAYLPESLQLLPMNY